MITTINEWKQYLIKESYFKDEEYYIEKAIEEYDDNYLEEIYEMEYPDNDPNEDEEHYKEFMYDFFSRTIEDILDDVYHTLENEPEIYRKITVSKEWTIDNLEDRNLGIFWSYEENAAEPHWGYDSTFIELLLVGDIENNKDIVDIEETILLNMNPSIGEDEKEIRLIEGKQLLITEVNLDGETIEVNKHYTT